MFLCHEKGANALTPRRLPLEHQQLARCHSSFVDPEYYVNGRGSFSGKQGLPARPPPPNKGPDSNYFRLWQGPRVSV